MARDGGTVRGIWPVLEALRSGRVVERVLLRRGPLSDQLREVQQVARQTGVPIQLVPPERLDRATKGDHQGVVAFVSEVPVQDLDEVIAKAYEAGRTPLLLALDGVTDVRNIGAISRSAECFGADALIVPMAGSARLGPDAIKSSAGALMRLPVCRVGNLVKALERARGHGLHIAACTEKGPHALDAGNLGQPLVLVLGSEGEGVSAPILRMADELLRIPMQGRLGSLNVSVAAGIALYTVSRSRSDAGSSGG